VNRPQQQTEAKARRPWQFSLEDLFVYTFVVALAASVLLGFPVIRFGRIFARERKVRLRTIFLIMAVAAVIAAVIAPFSMWAAALNEQLSLQYQKT
jgi:hypothetical protein